MMYEKTIYHPFCDINLDATATMKVISVVQENTTMENK